MLRKLMIVMSAMSFPALAACDPASVPTRTSPSPADTDAPSLDDAVSTEPGQPAGPAAMPSYAPQPGDRSLTRGPVFLGKSELRIAESYPVQIFVGLKGSLPTPCHQLRVAVAKPDDQKRLKLDVYSVAKPDQVCIQVLHGFEQGVSLGGGFPSGTYTVWVNGQRIGEFTP